MQVVPGAPGASCADVVAPSPRPSPLPSPGRRTPRYPPPVLEERDEQLLEEKVGRVVCSWRWRRDCTDQVLEGHVKYKEADQAKELRRVGVYPPGGVGTRMVRCSCCQHWTPAARELRELEIKKLKNGQVKRVWTDWQPVCIDCFYAGLPLLVMVCLPSSPGSTTRIPDADMPGHLEGSGWQRRAKRDRRRYLGPGGTVQEEVVGEDGFVYDLLVVPPPPAPKRGEEAGVPAEKGAA